MNRLSDFLNRLPRGPRQQTYTAGVHGRRQAQLADIVDPVRASACQARQRDDEKGSAIIWILIAIALFAALSWAMSRTTSSSTSFMTNSQAEAKATEIMAYGNDVKQAVKRVTLRGCSDTDISFENDIVGGYFNVNTPPDRCKVFLTSGGGLAFQTPPANSNDGTNWLFTGANVASGVSTNPSLIMMLRNINSAVCTEINDRLDVSPLANDATIDFTQFTGSYAATQTINQANGFVQGCQAYDNGDDEYFYYNVLIKR